MSLPVTALKKKREENAHLIGHWTYNDDDMKWSLEIEMGNLSSHKNHSNGNKRFHKFVMPHAFWDIVWLSNGRNRNNSYSVLLKDYLIVPFKDGDDAIIYIYQMELCPHFENNEISYHDDSSTIWTMQDLYKRELETTHSRKRRKICDRDNVFVHARIAHLSPILTKGNHMGKKDDAFSLMWLINKDGDEFNYGTMVVLRGSLILHYWHTGLLPGKSILLNISTCNRQEWKLPKQKKRIVAHDFPSDYNDIMIPTYVWLVTDPSQIRIYHNCPKIKKLLASVVKNPCGDAKEKHPKKIIENVNSSSNTTRKFQSQEEDRLDLSVRTAALVTIQGKITKVHFRNTEKTKKNRVMDFIVLESGHDEDPQRSQPIQQKLYLSYFPISVNLIRGLQVGCSARAINVHIITKNNQKSIVYGACLRSKLEILAILPKVMVKTTSSCDDKLISSNDAFISKIQHTYADMEHMQQFKNSWSSLCNDEDTCDSEPYSNNFCMHWKQVWKAIQGTQQNLHASSLFNRRDPYLEFLDPHIQNDKNMKISGGCCIANNEGRSNRCKLTSLYELITIGTNSLRTTLLKEEKQSSLLSSSAFKRGQLYSIHLSAKDILFESSIKKGLCQNKEAFTNIENIWVSGERIRCTPISKKTPKSFVLHHKNLQLTVCPIIKYNKVLNNIQHVSQSLPASDKSSREEIESKYDREFVIIQMKALVVSAICIGKQFHYTKCRKINDANNTILLPSLNSSSRSSTLILVQDWVFVIFLQLWYHDENISIISNQKCNDRGKNGKNSKNGKNVKINETKEELFNHGTILDRDPGKCFVTVRESLSSSLPLGEEKKKIIGRFIRQRWAFRKLSEHSDASKVTSYISLTLSHLNPEKAQSQILYNLQSIELTVRINFLQRDRLIIKQFLQNIHNQDSCLTERMQDNNGNERKGIVLDEGSIELVCALQKITENPNIVSILSGGFDETSSEYHYNNGSDFNHNEQILIFFPQNSLEITNMGFKRFACSCEDIDTIITQSHNEYEICRTKKYSTRDTSLPIQFPSKSFVCPIVGGSLFLPGTLDKRFVSVPTQLLQHDNGLVRRTNLFAPSLSEYEMEHKYGIPTCSLIDIQWDLCRDYCRQDTIEHCSAPSLVRRISHSRLINITFCRARVQCTRCFKFLTFCKTHQQIDRFSNKIHAKGKINGYLKSVKRKSFWHLPLTPSSANNNEPYNSTKRESFNPCSSTHEMHSSSFGNKHEFEIDATKSKLVCPSGCSIKHASVKWECSGTLDDGTCQAKLYAEREVALLLLGKDLDTEIIEQGAWSFENGIEFVKSYSLDSTINHVISRAQSKAKQLLRRNKKNIGVTESLFLQQMSIIDRAKYLIYRHCRDYFETSRSDRIFFCRCKSIDSKIEDLHSLQKHTTQISAIRHNQDDCNMHTCESIRSYSLPPLRLVLLDISLSRRKHGSKSRRTAIDQGWDYIRARTKEEMKI